MRTPTASSPAKILRLDYLRADEAAGFVTPMLSDGGAIAASGGVEDGIDPSLDDAGADNYAGPPTLVIRDYEDKVEEIVSVLTELDKQPSWRSSKPTSCVRRSPRAASSAWTSRCSPT